jgi:hypothetical protein
MTHLDRLPARLFALTLALVAIVTVVHPMAPLGPSETTTSSTPDGKSGQLRRGEVQGPPVWSADDGGVTLYAAADATDEWICPRIRGSARTPLCRRFGSKISAVCESEEGLLILLTDGDIHRVNRALVGTDGSFAPAYDYSGKLNIVDAWLPAAACAGGGEPSGLIAVDHQDNVLRFEHGTWRRID